MRKFTIDTFFRGKELQSIGSMDRKKQSIFGGAPGAHMSSVRGSRVTHGYGQTNFAKEKRIINGEQVLNILSYRKLNLEVDFDTQIDLKDNIVNILSVNAHTGSVIVQISTLLTNKAKNLQKILVPEKDPQRELRNERRAEKIKLSLFKTANKLVKGSGMKHLLEKGEKLSRKIVTFGDLKDQDIEQVLRNSK